MTTADDDIVEDTILYISEHKYPDGGSNSRKRQIRKKAEKICAEE